MPKSNCYYCPSDDELWKNTNRNITWGFYFLVTKILQASLCSDNLWCLKCWIDWNASKDGCIDAPPNSLKDSNVSPKMKITEEGVGVHSLARSTLGVRRPC